jgi:hypothetical protein
MGKLRFPRFPLKGADPAEHWQINTAGLFYRKGTKQAITHDYAGLPTIDLGHGYGGPVPKPGCCEECKLCLYQHSSGAHEAPRPYRHEASTKRLVEEVVCFQFHGKPPHGWDASRVHHIDGNAEHNTPENLTWKTDQEVLEWRQFVRHKGLLRPGSRTRGTIGARRMGNYSQPVFTDSAGLPTTPMKIGA